MWDEKRLGVVGQVRSSSITVLLDPQIQDLSKKIGSKTYFIGQIGSYVLIPVGKLMVIGIVSEFKKMDYADNAIVAPRFLTESEKVKGLLTMIFGLDGSSKSTIMDMSAIPFDIVNTVVALIARLSFNFWNSNRHDLPILLVFEEAHNYLSNSAEGSKAARRTVERIAKEGCKSGVSFMIVSQRPSEISETIVSQCSNFVILRLLNPVDQTYIRRLAPETFSGLDTVIPMLHQGEALVLGDAMPMPLRVQIELPNPQPDSADVKFFDKWKQKGAKTEADDVMERWWNQQKA